ncbi:zinc ribbon domain-containing protein [Ancylothrix sp. D3o]|nr:zinc ribbon domain-containing protein [Ancylothrix sp. D3o]
MKCRYRRACRFKCSRCGTLVQKSLSTRTHVCGCGFVSDRDWNALLIL